MAASHDVNRAALTARIVQRLAGPAETIVGFQTLIVDNMRRLGPAEAVEDAEMVLLAARDLRACIGALLAVDSELRTAAIDDARLRHDLRTPVNAILGYSELILEEQADALDDTLRKDIETVVAECGHVLEQIGSVVDFSHGNVDAVAADAADIVIAEALARSLDHVPTPADVRTGQILVIDDIEANRELLRRHLSIRGHVVTTVGSAREALELLEHTGFELALVDILMPDMNGIELLGHLKADARWREMAVVMVSGLTDIQAVVKCIKAGAADYLQKPVDPVLLHARVDSCLEGVRWRARERQFLAKIEYEKSRADGLLLSMLPETIIERLGQGETIIADRFDAVTIIFADIVDFTPLVARTDPTVLVRHLHDLFSRFDELADLHGVEKIKTIGDAYMAVVGVPEMRDDHADRALDFARAMIALETDTIGSEKPLRIRVGVSSGPVIAGLIGQKRFVYDVWGETVNFASRLEATGQAGRIHTSQATLSALKSRPPGRRIFKYIKGLGRTETYLLS